MGKIDTTPVMSLSYNDITIKPAVISNIRHRSECHPMAQNGFLPLFTAPMDSVVSVENYETFKKNRITPIIPRTVDIEKRIDLVKKNVWIAVSLTEFEKYFMGEEHLPIPEDSIYNVLIDVANGHMQVLYDDAKEANKIYDSKICLMIGNIANPEAYRMAFEADINYIRVGVGAGACCTTASNTGIHMPMASLISEVNEIRQEIRKTGVCGCRLPKIVADGGIRNYSDIIKALALGADYVMCGSVFSSMLESAASKVIDYAEGSDVATDGGSFSKIYKRDGIWYGVYADDYINEANKTRDDEHKLKREEVPIGVIKAKIYGMASKKGQIAMNGAKQRTSEGIEKTITVDYTMEQWCENFRDYLTSAMSYCDSKNLTEFRDKSHIVVISNNTYNSVNK